MSDLATIRDRILTDINRKDLSAVAENEIQTAIHFYEKRRFYFLECRATASTVDGQEYYGVPSDFRDLDSITVAVSNNTYPLTQRHWGTIEDWFVKSTTFTGYPTDFALRGSEFRLYPVPNGSYQLTLSYVRQLATLSDESASSSWVLAGEAEQLIRTRAERIIQQQVLRDFDAAQALGQLEQEILSQHERLTAVRASTGHTKRRRM